MTDWDNIKGEYLGSDISLRALAKKYGMRYSSVQTKARRELWRETRDGVKAGDSQRRMEQVTEKLLRRMEKTIDESEELDSRDIKAMTGALKELKEIQRQDDGAHGEDRDEVMEVCFMGDTEELSR